MIGESGGSVFFGGEDDLLFVIVGMKVQFEQILDDMKKSNGDGFVRELVIGVRVSKEEEVVLLLVVVVVIKEEDIFKEKDDVEKSIIEVKV